LIDVIEDMMQLEEGELSLSPQPTNGRGYAAATARRGA
jgi:hypothetical protein